MALLEAVQSATVRELPVVEEEEDGSGSESGSEAGSQAGGGAEEEEEEEIELPLFSVLGGKTMANCVGRFGIRCVYEGPCGRGGGRGGRTSEEGDCDKLRHVLSYLASATESLIMPHRSFASFCRIPFSLPRCSSTVYVFPLLFRS